MIMATSLSRYRLLLPATLALALIAGCHGRPSDAVRQAGHPPAESPEAVATVRPTQGITPSDFDSIQDQYRSAAATLQESKAAVEQALAEKVARAAEQAQAEAAVEAAKAKVTFAEADRDRAAAFVGFAKIQAPF